MGAVTGHEAPVPAQHGARLHDQQQPGETAAVQGLGQHREHSPVGAGEPGPFDLTLQDQHLMAQSQDLRIASVTRQGYQHHTSRDETNEPGQQTDHDPASYPPSKAPLTSADVFSAPSRCRHLRLAAAFDELAIAI